MSIHKLLPLLALLLNVLLIGSALAGDRKSPRHYVFALLAGALAVWNLGVFGLRGSGDPATALTWERFLHYGVILIPVLFYHYVLAFLDQAAQLPAHRRLCDLRRLPRRVLDRAVHARRDLDELGVRAALRARCTRCSSCTCRRTSCWDSSASFAPTRRSRRASGGIARSWSWGASSCAPRRAGGLRALPLRLGLAVPPRHPQQRGLRAGPGPRHRALSVAGPRDRGQVGDPLHADRGHPGTRPHRRDLRRRSARAGRAAHAGSPVRRGDRAGRRRRLAPAAQAGRAPGAPDVRARARRARHLDGAEQADGLHPGPRDPRPQPDGRPGRPGPAHARQPLSADGEWLIVRVPGPCIVQSIRESAPRRRR